MKKGYKIIFLFIVLLPLFLICPFSYAASSDLNLNNLRFDVILNEDGSMDVAETWEIKIRDTNTLFKTFIVDDSRYSDITDVKVVEILDGKEQQFQKINQEMYHVTKGCYYGLINKNGDFEIAWGVSEKNVTKTYKITYKVMDAVKNYTDCSELYWQFIGSDFEIPITSLYGTIILPNEVENIDSLRVWAHGPLNGNIERTDKKTITFDVLNVSANQMVEIRVAVLENVFLNNSNSKNATQFSNILSEEEKWAKQANNDRDYLIKKDKEAEMIYWIFIAIVIGVSIIGIYKSVRILKQYPKKQPTQKLDYYRELPNENTTPAEAAFLYYFKSTKPQISQIISATMLDLCLKGFIEFSVVEEKKKSEILITLKNLDQKNHLKEHEKIVLELLEKTKKENSDSFTMKEFQKYIEKNSNIAFVKIKKIDSQVEKEQEESGNYRIKDKKKKNNQIGFASLFFLILFIMVPFFLSMLNSILTISATIFTIIIAGVCIALIFISASRFDLTQKGIDEKEMWKALKRYMEEFSLLKEKEVPDLVLWEKFLVYATAFGIANKVLKQLKITYPNFDATIEYRDSSFMYLMYHHSLNTSFISSLNASVNRAYHAGMSGDYGSYSSGGGYGGGFSSGGRRRWRPEAGGGGR